MSRDPDAIDLLFPRLGSRRKFKIAVEGNISSGKTTLLNHFRNKSYAKVMVEPVEKWQNLGGDNILGRMYEDPQRWGYSFQSYVLLTMMEVHNASQDVPLGILERSVYSARYCFVENLHRSGVIDDLEYKCYVEWFDYLMKDKRPQLDLIVYLRTSPEVCYERLRSRARQEESTVSLDYLKSLHNHYETWLANGAHHHWHGNTPVLVLDGNQDMVIHEFLHSDMVNQITAFLANIPTDTRRHTCASLATAQEVIARA